jgi:hypothetical protein
MAAKENTIKKMKINKQLLEAILFFLLSSCKSPADKIMDDFNKVNKQLEKSNQTLDSTSGNLRFTGFDKKTADSILLVLNNAFDFLKKIKSELNKKDPNGEKPDAAEKILLQTDKGDSLFIYMVGVRNLENEYLTDTGAKKENYITVMKAYKSEWLTKYFKGVPTIAAQTILSKFQNDCRLIKMGIAGAGISKLKEEVLVQ